MTLMDDVLSIEGLNKNKIKTTLGCHRTELFKVLLYFVFVTWLCVWFMKEEMDSCYGPTKVAATGVGQIQMGDLEI